MLDPDGAWGGAIGRLNALANGVAVEIA